MFTYTNISVIVHQNLHQFEVQFPQDHILQVLQIKPTIKFGTRQLQLKISFPVKSMNRLNNVYISTQVHPVLECCRLFMLQIINAAYHISQCPHGGVWHASNFVRQYMIDNDDDDVWTWCMEKKGCEAQAYEQSEKMLK